MGTVVQPMSQQLTLKVPDGTSSGTMLNVKQKGIKYKVAVPEGLQPGDQFTADLGPHNEVGPDAAAPGIRRRPVPASNVTAQEKDATVDQKKKADDEPPKPPIGSLPVWVGALRETVEVSTALFTGVQCNVKAVQLVVNTPELRSGVISRSSINIGLALLTALIIWCPLAAVRWVIPDAVVPSFVPELCFTSILSVTSLVALNILQTLMPAQSGSQFFGTLQVCHAEAAEQLTKLEVLRGFMTQVQELGKLVGMLFVLCTAGLILAVTVGPVVASLMLGGLLFLMTPMGLLVLVVVIPILVFVGFAGSLMAPFLAAVSAMQRIGVPVGPALLLGVLIGCFPAHALTITVGTGWAVTYASHMGQQLLTQPAIRMSAEEWIAWGHGRNNNRRWAMIGLGLPAWLLAQVHPLLVVGCLDLMQAAGAVYWGIEARPEVD